MARKSRKNMIENTTVTNRTYRAAAYLRLSVVKEDVPSDSIENQLCIIKDFVAAHSDIQLTAAAFVSRIFDMAQQRKGLNKIVRTLNAEQIPTPAQYAVSRGLTGNYDQGNGLWETLYNPNFKPLEFEGFKARAGSNAFTLSPKRWIEATGAIGMYSKSGRGGGTFAHRDIAFEFASWISAEFKLYIITDYQRLKADENSRLSLNWNMNREISKINYRIHTDAIKEHLIVLSNMESLNAEMIKRGIKRDERVVELNRVAKEQMRLVLQTPSVQKLLK